MSFETLNLDPALQRALATAGYAEPTEVQRRAMAAAEEWARASGHTKLQLLVRNSNAPVLSFYDALGYEESAVKVLQKWHDPAREKAFRDNLDVH